MPATTRKVRPELDRLYHDTFVTALEGGINYWSHCKDYRWSLGDGQTEDLLGFGVQIQVTVDGADEDRDPWLTINRAVIARGFRRLASGDATYGGRPIRGHDHARSWIARAAGWLADPEGADLDASDADVIVQVGLFGDVTYG